MPAEQLHSLPALPDRLASFPKTSTMHNRSDLEINLANDLGVFCDPCKLVLDVEIKGYTCELDWLAKVFGLLCLGFTRLGCAS